MCGRRPNSKNSKTVGNIFDVFRGFRFLLAGGIRRSIQNRTTAVADDNEVQIAADHELRPERVWETYLAQ